MIIYTISRSDHRKVEVDLSVYDYLPATKKLGRLSSSVVKAREMKEPARSERSVEMMSALHQLLSEL